MDPEEYSWSNQTNLVSSLDLLEEEVLRETSKPGPQWNRDKQLLVEGEPAITILREVSRISPRKPSFVPKSSGRRRPSTSQAGKRSANNAEEEEGSSRHVQLENERLQHQIKQWQREVEHAREEKQELEASFRRLDQEIGSGCHLAERKEKELRIAELVMKNQKMSRLLEKELQSHEELRRVYAEQQNEHKKRQEQVTLLNRVLDSVEAKYAELLSSHTTLTASYEAAQTAVETLQHDVHTLQDKLATSATHVQVVTEYEEKVQQWEQTCRELERKCDRKIQKLAQTQQIASAAQQEVQRARHRQEQLEQEVSNAHDQLIQTNAAMRTMEAKLEANLKTAQQRGSHESLYHRVRQLEGELLRKNRDNTDLMQTCNQLLGSRKRTGTNKSSLSARDNQTMASRVVKLTTRIASLTDKLRSAEEVRDRKSRSLDVLMQAFPFLLHRLDALQDQFTAAVESNDILQSALEQMQAPPISASSWNNPINSHNEASYGVPRVSGSMYLHLARETYLLEAPYPVELLADQTGAQALNGNSVSTAMKRKFSPFRVTCSALNLQGNQHEEKSDDQTHQLVLLSADSTDQSGASYLNRSKINAFLEVIQSSAARTKFKTLVIGKLAECLNKLRELAHRSASEAAAHNASIQMLHREVVDLQHKLKSYPKDSHDAFNGVASTTAKTSKDVGKMRHFMLKVVDVYADKQQESDQRQMTFLTQPFSSDMLITKAHRSQRENNCVLDDQLCLADCGLDDDDVGQLLLKVLVSGVRFCKIILDSNNLSDIGVQHVADFLEKAPPSVRMVSFVGNKRVTSRSIDLIRRGLLNNQRVQRVKEDNNELDNGIVMYGLALGRDFDDTGNATEILRVVLPIPAMNEVAEMGMKTTTTEAVDAMTERLRQLGFRYNIRPASASGRLQSTTTKTCIAGHQNVTRSRNSVAASSTSLFRRALVPNNSVATFNRRAPAASSTATNTNSNRRRSLPGRSTTNNETSNRRQQAKTQQELRFQALEAAIRRASGPSSRHLSSSRSVNTNTGKRTFSRAHVDTIRGLRR